MLLKAVKDWNIDLSRSYMIGDSTRDEEAGRRAGCKASIRIATNEPNALLKTVEKLLH